MKRISYDQAQSQSFEQIIDVRSPSEYQLDHLIKAINLPVLDDAERAEVGTLYAQQGAFVAKKIGAAKVARNIARHLEQHFAPLERHTRVLLYCWRGGNRSEALAHVLDKIGFAVSVLDGGYKHYRQRVLQALAQRPFALQWVVICGPTGSGKTALLGQLEQAGAQVLDLEQLAAHRGSLLGMEPEKSQPSQKWFDSVLHHKLSGFKPDQVVFVESESRKLGTISLPEALLAAMRQGRAFHVSCPRAQRSEHILASYLHWQNHSHLLQPVLDKLAHYHSAQERQQWQQWLDNGAFAPLVERLLEQHYDKLYAASLQRHYPHAQHLEGSTSAQWLLQLLGRQ